MAIKVCIVCRATLSDGNDKDGRVLKTACPGACVCLLVDWAMMPDPKPTLRRYLEASTVISGKESDPEEEGHYEGSF